MSINIICKAGGKNGNHPNYNKPHVPVEGKYNGEPWWFCIFCGANLGRKIDVDSTDK